MAWEIRFYSDGQREPLREWLDSLKGKDIPKRLAAIAAIEEVLAKQGIDVCETEWGNNLGKGLYELRIRHDARTIRQMFGGDAEEGQPQPAKIVLRIFFTTAGRQVVLLLVGYDKGKEPSKRRQQSAIEEARRMIQELRRRKP